VLWQKTTNGPFPYEYTPNPAYKPGPPISYRVETSGQARMIWGNTQEATALLAAVNFLAKEGAIVREAGLCALEAVGVPEHLHPKLLPGEKMQLFGASPDAIAEFPDGRIEVIEVKNHAPFREGGTTWKSTSRGQRMTVSDPGPFKEVATWHVPQLQLEMLCLGPKCTNALFVSCSATRGVVLQRLARNDEYIRQMLALAATFDREVIRAGNAPYPDFAAKFEGHAQLLELTLEVAASATVVAEIAPHNVQRSPFNKRMFLD